MKNSQAKEICGRERSEKTGTGSYIGGGEEFGRAEDNDHE